MVFSGVVFHGCFVLVVLLAFIICVTLVVLGLLGCFVCCYGGICLLFVFGFWFVWVFAFLDFVLLILITFGVVGWGCLVTCFLGLLLCWALVLYCLGFTLV